MGRRLEEAQQIQQRLGADAAPAQGGIGGPGETGGAAGVSAA